MTALQHVGAAAPGQVTPASDEAPAGGTAQGFRVRNAADSPHSAVKRITTATAELAMLGIEARTLRADTWVLLHAGKPIATVTGTDALAAAADGYGRARRDVQVMLERMRGGR